LHLHWWLDLYILLHLDAFVATKQRSDVATAFERATTLVLMHSMIFGDRRSRSASKACILQQDSATVYLHLHWWLELYILLLHLDTFVATKRKLNGGVVGGL
jgi:hypothetical protein